MSDKKLPVGDDGANDRHRQTVESLKKDNGAASRAQIANKALVMLSDLNDQVARGLSLYDDAGNVLTVDQALARKLAGRMVHARPAPDEVEVRVTKGPIIGEK